MKREFLLSLTVHVLFIAATLISSPFQPKSQVDYGDVIRVSLPDFASPPTDEPIAIPPLEVPKPVVEDMMDIPINDPTTRPAAEIDEPEPEPEPEPEEKPKNKINIDAEKSDRDQSGSAESEVDDASLGGAGSPFAGATVDNAAWNYDYYDRQIFAKLRANHRVTVAYDGILVCVVSIEIISSGRVIDVQVVESSGVPAYDRNCLATIERTRPCPPLPRDYRYEIIRYTISIRYTPE